MTQTIQLAEDLARAAASRAEAEGITQDELYERALRDYLAQHDRRWITQAIDAVCDRTDTALDPALRANAVRSMQRSEW